MGYIIPPGFSRVTFEYSAINPLGSKPCWGFGCASDPNDTILDLIQAWYEEDYNPLVSEAYLLERISMRNDVEAIERSMALAGITSTSDAQPQVAALIKYTTGLVGRQNRGRIYLPGVLTEATVGGNGLIQESKRNDIQAAVELLGTSLLAAEAPVVILHSTVSDPTPVTGGNVQAYCATQRRRMRA